ncbi:MAG: O-antigen ligase family protein [Terriglobales bacterium]
MAFNTGLGNIIPLMLYVGILVASLLAMVWRPILGLYVLTLLIPLQTTREKLQQFPAGDHVIYILILSVIIGGLMGRGAKLPRSPLNGIIIALFVLTYISLWHGSFFLNFPVPLHMDYRMTLWANLAFMPVLYFASLYAIKDEKQMRILLAIMSVSAFLVAFTFFRTNYGRDFSHFSWGRRDAGTIGYAGVNGLGAYAAGALAFIVAYISCENSKIRKLGLLGLIAILMYSLLYSYSRGAYMGFIAALVIQGFLKNRKLLIIVVVLLCSWRLILPESVLERITMTYGEDGKLESSSADRVLIWEDAEKLVMENPLFGTGFATYAFMHRVKHYEDTHNYYMKMIVENGSIGLILLLAVILTAARQSYLLFRSAEQPFFRGVGLGLLGLLTSVLIVNIFGDRFSYLQVNGCTWVLMACVVRSRVLLQEASEAPAAAEAKTPLMITEPAQPVMW